MAMLFLKYNAWAGTILLFVTMLCSTPAVCMEQPDGDEILLGTASELPSWLQTPDGYVYRPAGKPDPFRPFVRPAPPASVDRGFEPDIPRRPLTPLEQVEVNQLRTVGILWRAEDPGAAIAMVEMPDGKAYVLRPGVMVGRNGGAVQRITDNKIIIEETGRDYTGKPVTRTIVLELHPSPGEEQ